MNQPTLFPDTDDRRAALAAEIGIAPERIQSVKLQLDVLRKQGILVDLDISGLSMFARAASWMELGILDDDVRRDRFTRGQKFLIPEDQVKRLRSVESQMRQALERYSFHVTGFYPYRWIPFTAYDEFRRAWAELTSRFAEVRQEILDHYDDYKDRLVNDFNQVAAEAWASIQRAAGDRQPIVIIEGWRFTDLEAFTNFIVQRALERFPSRQRIEQDLYADYTTALVYGEQDVAADELAAERLRRQISQEREEQRHQEQLHRLAEEARRIKIEAMRQAEAEHARQRLEQMVSPFEEVFSALRRRIAEDAQAMLQSIQKNGYVRGKIAEKGRGLLDLYDLLAAHNDYELRDKLVHLKAAIGPIGAERAEDAPERSAAEIVTLLNQVVDLAHTAAQDLLTKPSRFSLLEV